MIIIRYLIKETIKTQLGVLFVLFLIFFCQKFIRVLANASAGTIPADYILTLVTLYMPRMAMLMLPLSLYISILLTFGRLYANQEMTIMKATGMGNKLLFKAVLYLILLTSVLATLNSLWFAPWANDKEVQVNEEIAAKTSLDLLTAGQFQATPDGTLVIFVDKIANKGNQLTNVFIAQPTQRESLRPGVVIARYGRTSKQPDGTQALDLYDGYRYEAVVNQLDYSVTHYDRYNAIIKHKQTVQEKRDWDAMPTRKLLHESNIEAKAELQWRLSLILSVLLMSYIVIPLSEVNPRQGRFAKIVPAALLYLCYFLSLSATKSALESKALPEYIGLWSVNLVAFIIGVVLNNLQNPLLIQIINKIKGERN